MIGVVIAVAVLLVLAQQGGALGGSDVARQQGALSTLEIPPPAQPRTVHPQSSVSLEDKTHAVLNKVLPAGAGVVGAAACSFYGLGAAAPVCAKVGSALEKPARKLANFTTAKATDFGGKALVVQANTLNKLTAGAGSLVAGKVASVADNLSNSATKKFGIGGTIAVAPLKITADLGAKGAAAVAKGGSAIAHGVKSATSAVSSGVHKVLGFL